MSKLLFWAFAALDGAALLLFFFLGLAAAGSARTSPAQVVLVLLVLPGLVLLAAIAVFLRASSLPARGLAFALVAAPLLIVVLSKLVIDARVGAHTNAQGELTFFEAGPQRDLAEAIRRNDVQAVTAALSRADVKAGGMMGMTPLVLALRQLRTTPTEHGALQALLAAGADPNQGVEYEQPLEMALQIGIRSGPAPVRMLLEAGAQPNRRNAAGRPIYFGAAGLGASVDLLDLVLRHGADLRASGPGEETVLIYAAGARSWRAVRLLLEKGADPQQGRTARGQQLRDLVGAALQELQHRQPQSDDGLQAVVDMLRSR